jgi:endonuclease/exonuclease/phosphatase family metal-dependent hydrolase
MSNPSLKLSVISFNVLAAPFLTTHSIKNYFLLTWNLLGRIRAIGNLLNNSGADVLCLQEVHSHAALQYLKRQLSRYPYVAYKQYLYGPRGGLVIFSKMPFVSTEYVDFLKHGSFRDKSFPAKLSQNGMLVVKLKNYPLYIMNTYITADTEHKWNSESKHGTIRALQINQLAYLIKTLSFMNNEVVVTGDMNTPKGSELYNELLRKAMVMDSFSHKKHYTQHADFFPVEIEPQVLDYIFYTQYYHTVSLESASQLFDKKILLENKKESYLSDHIALQVTFSYTFSGVQIQSEVFDNKELKQLLKHEYVN